MDQPSSSMTSEQETSSEQLGSKCLDVSQNVGITSIHDSPTSHPEAERKSLLLEFCRKGDFENVSKILDLGCDPNSSNERNVTALHFAARSGNLELINLLLEKGAKHYLSSDDGLAPLVASVIHGHLPVVKKLLSISSVDINRTYKESRTLLQFAISEGHLSVVSHLFENGADPEIVDSNGDTALHLALKLGRESIARLMLDKNVDVSKVDSLGNNALHIVCSSGQEEVFKLIVKKIKIPYSLFLDQKNKDGYSAVHLSIIHNHPNLLGSLLSLKADIEQLTNSFLTPLLLAVQFNRTTLVEILINYGADIHKKSNDSDSVVHFSIRNRNLDLTNFFMQEGVDMQSQNCKGFSPFMEAVQTGYKEMIDFLYFNSKCHLSDKLNHKVLHILAENGDLLTFKTMVSLGCKTSIKDENGFTPLHYAAKFGKVALVEFLLDCGEDINCKSNSFHTPLHMAAENNHLEVVQLLLKNNATHYSLSTDGSFPLYLALENGHNCVADVLLEVEKQRSLKCYSKKLLSSLLKRNDVQHLKVLYENGLQLTSLMFDNNSSLHIAALYGHLEITKFLLDTGLNYNLKNVNGLTPLHMACEGGNLDVVEYLIYKGATIHAEDKHGQTPIFFAVSFSHEKIVKFLIDKGAEVNHITRSGLCVLHKAAEKNNSRIIAILLENNANPCIMNNESRDMPLHISIRKGDFICSDMLSNHEMLNVENSDGHNPFTLAVQHGRMDLAELFLIKGCDLSTKEQGNLLHCIAAHGHLSMMSLLLQKGLDLNAVDSSKRNLLHIACEKSNIELAKYLIELGIDKKVQDCNGRTPLHTAFEVSDSRFINHLITMDEELSSTCEFSCTALNLAAKRGLTETVKLLLDRGHCVNVANENSWTPLHFASDSNEFETCELLIKSGARLDDRNRDGNTPLHLASDRGYPELVQLLLSSGAKKHIINRQNESPLHMATKKGHLPVFKLIVEKTNLMKHFSYFHEIVKLAVSHRVIEVLKVIENYGGYIFSEHCASSIFHDAVMSGNLDMVMFFLEDRRYHSEYFNQVNNLNPLHLACKYGHSNLVKVLEKYINIDSKSTGIEKTPLHYAAERGCISTVQELLKMKANVNAKTLKNSEKYSGETPLSLAIRGGHVEVVKLLLRAGAVTDDICSQTQNATFMANAVHRSLSATYLAQVEQKKDILDFLPAD